MSVGESLLTESSPTTYQVPSSNLTQCEEFNSDSFQVVNNNSLNLQTDLKSRENSKTMQTANNSSPKSSTLNISSGATFSLF